MYVNRKWLGNMKNNIKMILVSSSVIIIMGILITILPWFKETHNSNILFVAMFISAGMNLIQFILDKKFEKWKLLNISTCIIVCLLCLILGNKKISDIYPFVFIVWVSFNCIIKLLELDYLHDNYAKNFNIFAFTSIIFFVLGITTTISLYFNEVTSTFVLGYFFIVYGILNITEEYSKIKLSGSKK